MCKVNVNIFSNLLKLNISRYLGQNLICKSGNCDKVISSQFIRLFVVLSYEIDEIIDTLCGELLILISILLRN